MKNLPNQTQVFNNEEPTKPTPNVPLSRTLQTKPTCANHEGPTKSYKRYLQSTFKRRPCAKFPIFLLEFYPRDNQSAVKRRPCTKYPIFLLEFYPRDHQSAVKRRSCAKYPIFLLEFHRIRGSLSSCAWLFVYEKPFVHTIWRARAWIPPFRSLYKSADRVSHFVWRFSSLKGRPH